MKYYELSNHLGNILSVVSDRKKPFAKTTNQNVVDFYVADIKSVRDYYPFGMEMPGRKFTSSSYRYGFNGKEKDKEITSTTTYDYGFRIYSPGLGRFLSVDPLTKNYAWNSTYAFAENESISNIDLDGLEKYKVTIRTFLPYTYVWEPQSKDIIDKANTRWYPQYRNVEAHGGYKSEQQFNVDFYSGTSSYISPFTPGTYSKDVRTGIVEFDNNEGLGDKGTMATMIDGNANIHAKIATKNPSTPTLLPTPAIDYNLNISVTKDGTWMLNGIWDGFPSLEVYLENLETGQVDLIHFDNTSDAGKDLKNGSNPAEIMNLFPIRGDVEIKKSGHIGEHPQHDHLAPSPKVSQNNQRFSNSTQCNCDPQPRDHRGN